MSETIVLVHGLWMTPLSWEQWVERFSERGHDVIAPAWPGMDRTVESLAITASSLRSTRSRSARSATSRTPRRCSSRPSS